MYPSTKSPAHSSFADSLNCKLVRQPGVDSWILPQHPVLVVEEFDVVQFLDRMHAAEVVGQGVYESKVTAFSPRVRFVKAVLNVQSLCVHDIVR